MIFGPFKLVLKIISSFFSLVLFYYGFTIFQIWSTSHDHATANAQAILVFGTAEMNGMPSPALAARLDQAAALYKAQRAPWVVVTGGNRPGDLYTESGVSKVYLEQRGVPANRILQGFGDDTWQNVTTSLGTLRSHHIHTVLTVTDPFHEYRAMAISSSNGLSPQPSPVPSSPTIKGGLWGYYLKEGLDVSVGRIVGYGTLSSWTTGVAKVYPAVGG